MDGLVPASRLIHHDPVHGPTMTFSGEGHQMPVHLRYHDDDDDVGYAHGGLAAAAHAVRDAGRGGDDEIIHVNHEELAELKRMWGPGSVNPQTGMHEFFLKKLFKGFKKIFKKILPILPLAASFIPGIGTAIGGIGSSILGSGASAAAASGLGNAIVGGGLSALGGGNVLQGALSGGLSGVLHPAAKPGLTASLPGASAPTSLPQVQTMPAPVAPPPMLASPVTPSPAPTIEATAPSVPDLSVTPAAAPSASPLAALTGKTASAAPSLAAKPNFFNQDFLGIKGLPNKLAIPGAILAAMALKKKKKSSSDDPLSHVPSSFNDPLPAPSGLYAHLGAKNNRYTVPNLVDAAERDGEKSYFDYSARGGAAGSNLRVRRPSPAVSGRGDGRSDSIDAKLSDGEYVMDAETVGLLGNGSSRAGAKALDQFRANVRRHKGRNLAVGKFSAKAKAPERYLSVKAR